MFAAIDSQAMSCYSNKAMVDPVLFRVLYGAGLRVSEALNLTLSDVDTSAGTLRIRDSKNGEGRTIPITGRLTATLDAYTTAAHPAPEHSDNVFYSRAADRPINQSTIYTRFRGYLADAGIPHFIGGPHPHSLRHGFAVANLRRWAADNADLAVMLPYLACYMGHADLRGTQYYLRLTADAYPEVMDKAQIRFGYSTPTVVPIPFPVPSGITKGRKFRTTWISYEALAAVHRYLDLDRAVTAEGSSWLPRRGEPLLVSEPDAQGGRINGVRRSWDTVTRMSGGGWSRRAAGRAWWRCATMVARSPRGPRCSSAPRIGCALGSNHASRMFIRTGCGIRSRCEHWSIW